MRHRLHRPIRFHQFSFCKPKLKFEVQYFQERHCIQNHNTRKYVSIMLRIVHCLFCIQYYVGYCPLSVVYSVLRWVMSIVCVLIHPTFRKLSLLRPQVTVIH
jgi:hypothetical protein